jgi:transcription-repair coupling factor (superfamily II helicase)
VKISQEAYIIEMISRLKNNKNLVQVVVASSEVEAQKLHSLSISLGYNYLSQEDIIYIPGFFQTGVYRYESSKKIISKRLSACLQITKSFPKLFICSSCGFTKNFPKAEWILNNKFEVATNDILDVELFIEELLHRVYIQVPKVEDIGEFAVRGSIVDFWSPGQSTPSRIEFFDDYIDKIRSFRVEDQRSFQTLQNLTILPSREFVWPDKSKLEFAIDKFNHAILSQKLIGVYRTNLLEDLKSNVTFAGIDDLAYMFSDEKFDSFYSIIQNESKKLGFELSCSYYGDFETIEKSFNAIDKLYEQSFLQSESKNILTPKKEIIFPKIHENLNILKEFEKTNNILFSRNIPLELENEMKPLEKQKFPSRVLKIKEKLTEKLIIENIVFCFKNIDSAIEFSGILAKYFTEFEKINLKEESNLFQAENIWSNKLNVTFVSNNVFYTFLDIEYGFYLPEHKSLFISENWVRGVVHKDRFENFSEENSFKNNSKTNSEIFLSNQFSDFIDGDLVVHIQHGIARFRGLMTITLLDITGDFLVLEFANNDKIYVPVHKLNLVQKYIGATESVTLDSLSSSNWEKRKEKTKKDIEKIAKELMEHQAKRAMTPGHAFAKIDEDYIAFEDAFPFDETPDQIKAIFEIMQDMTKPKAMDRLLCGDVGFGKTEVAMRAAFRCVLDGKQVAWLVPTTVLAHQHFRSLKERFHDFGVSVELLDRSVTSKSKTLQKVTEGKVDILIGTHRILSKDIQFRDLGLLVVDEEQRFGVLQKEKIKSISYGVDVLTMTATPIPRTLQMAMVGLRDLSLLHTPPKARLATKTFVCPFDDDILKEAIQFEISRGGQIFYVHNRVEELNSVLIYLKELLPQVRICIGHGKLSQNELEETILAFLDGKYDILLCTTIIESGIDMPNVNTIIVQNANKFGLAQLYQLRGRVGRRSTRGNAYFLISPDAKEDSEGLRRLDILKEHQELGSGFAIASHDLEMRGSGNVLGDEQSGKVNDVGLETYMQMLDDAIKNLGGVKVTPQTDVEIQVPFLSQIPENYIENSKERLRTYRRFFGARQESVLQNLLIECEDRFGALPIEVQNLAELARIRRMLLIIGATSLIVGENMTEIRLSAKVLQDSSSENEIFLKRILDVCNLRVKNMRLTPDGKILFPLRKKSFMVDAKDTIIELKRVLSLLAGEMYEKSDVEKNTR